MGTGYSASRLILRPSWPSVAVSDKNSYEAYACSLIRPPAEHPAAPFMRGSPSDLHLPTALLSEDDDAALRLLTRYFAPVVGDPGIYTGAAWDDWDPSGRRQQDIDEFTADDCMAVTLLSVNIPGQAAHKVLGKDRARYSALLAEVGPDRDLVEVAEPITDDWPAPVLYRAVRELPKVGRTKTSKLLARKRPALIPIWDSVIGGVALAGDYFWEPLRQQLRANDAALHHGCCGCKTRRA